MRRAVFVAALCAALVGCGYVGDPKPPSLDIPQVVTDLRAYEYGDKIIVQFSIPEQSTEALPLRSLSAVEVFAGPRSYSLLAPKTGALEYEFAASDWVGRDIELRVRATGPKGRVSAWSNVVKLTVIEPLELPSNLRVQNVREGVRLSWQGKGPRYRIFRANAAGEPQPLAESEPGDYLDQTSIYGMPYRYQVQAFASPTQQGVLTEPVPITPSDEFAPEVPAGVSGLAANASVELAWQPGADEDLAGYNIYRAIEDGAFELLASGVRSPAYSDSKVVAGKRYRYSVTSVDATGNESARTPPVEVVVP